MPEPETGLLLVQTQLRQASTYFAHHQWILADRWLRHAMETVEKLMAAESAKTLRKESIVDRICRHFEGVTLTLDEAREISEQMNYVTRGYEKPR